MVNNEEPVGCAQSLTGSETFHVILLKPMKKLSRFCLKADVFDAYDDLSEPEDEKESSRGSMNTIKSSPIFLDQ